MLSFLSSNYFWMAIGVALGLYIGNKAIQVKINNMIFKKKNKPPPSTSPNQSTNPDQPRKFVIVDGKKYYSDEN